MSALSAGEFLVEVIDEQHSIELIAAFGTSFLGVALKEGGGQFGSVLPSVNTGERLRASHLNGS